MGQNARWQSTVDSINSQSIGQQAEDAARNFLLRQGLRLIQKNYRCRLGEIDLIMRDKSSIVFVEVRYRKIMVFGGGAESVTRHKQNKLIKTAQHYLLCHRAVNNAACRFDVMAISPGIRELQISWIRDAFQLM